jgi:Na+-transporting methylmalonyl-CoA/oxaloacetate decarboxylase gamma subunit
MGDIGAGFGVSVISMLAVFTVLGLLIMMIMFMRWVMGSAGRDRRIPESTRDGKQGASAGRGHLAMRAPILTTSSSMADVSKGGGGVDQIPTAVIPVIVGAVTACLESEGLSRTGSGNEAQYACKLRSIKTIRRVANDAWAVSGRQALMDRATFRKVG